MFNGGTLTPKADITMLGVQLDKALTMNSFVNAKIRKINYHIRDLRQLRPSLNTKVAETIGPAISLSWLNYCNALLGGISAGKFILLDFSASKILLHVQFYNRLTSLTHWTAP